MTSFLTVLNGFYTNFGSKNETLEDCVSKIPESSFHFYLLIPSVLVTLLLSFTLQRKNRGLLCCWGRPGAVFPMDILGKSHRFSYAAAWGAIAFLAADLVLGSTVIVQLEGPPYVTVFNTVLSMIVIGIDYFPLFAALALESVTGYVVGTVYAWLLLAVQIFKEAECDLVVQTRLILVLRDLPNLLCLTYLSISIPVRTVQVLRKKTIRIFNSSETVSVLIVKTDVNTTPEALHVKELLRPPPPLPPSEETRRGKIVAVLKKLVGNWIYKRKRNFRYSARILSVMLIGLFVIYKVTLETMVVVISTLKLVEQTLKAYLDEIGWDPVPGEDESIVSLRDTTYLLYGLLINGKICFIVSASVACLWSMVTILHMLSSYRSNLFDLYKGNTTHIPHRSTRSNASLLIGSMRYAGYQVAYIAWGFVLHFIILLIVSFAICVVITLIQEGYYQWILSILSGAWPAVLMTVMIMLTQTLSSKYAFLQERGEALALNNRRVLFSFTFFMFFYNIFVGFLSCLLRIVKSIGVGAVMLPRLDNSALPRRFQMLDPGFANYCGFMHVECTHTHPVMLIFLRILLLGNQKKISSTSTESTELPVAAVHGKEEGRHASTRARTRWFLFYTLNSNPSLRVQRKFYLRLMKQLQERLAKQAEKSSTYETSEDNVSFGDEREHMDNLMLEVVHSDAFVNGKLNMNVFQTECFEKNQMIDLNDGNMAGFNASGKSFKRDEQNCDTEERQLGAHTKNILKLSSFNKKTATVAPIDV